MAKSKTVTVRGRKYWRAASEFKPTWREKQLELSCAESNFDACTQYFQKTVTEMRDAAKHVSRSVLRLEVARKAIYGKKSKKVRSR